MRSHRESRARMAMTFAFALSGFWGSSLGGQETTLIEPLISDMEAVFAGTPGMVEHTMTVHGYAVEIQGEEGGDLFVVRASAILHDIGIPRAREVHGSSTGEFQEIEGPPIAREILGRYAISPEAVDHICGIVANHHSDRDPEIVNTIEFQILWDADWLVNFPRRNQDLSNPEKGQAIDSIFKTTKGRRLAREMFLK